MTKLLVAVTVPHTGTRSLMNIIDLEGYLDLAKILHDTKEERKQKNRDHIFASLTGDRHHVYLSEYAYHLKLLVNSGNYKGIKEDPLIKRDKFNIIHGHINKNTLGAVRFLSKYTRLTTTCRDPLLTLVSTHQRDKRKLIEGKHKIGTSVRIQQEFEAWYLWAKYIYPTNPFIIPIDLKGKDLNYGGYDYSKIYDINVTHNKEGYPLKTAYKNKDLDLIKEELGENYDILLGMKPILEPILTEIGYDLWWI